MDETARRAVLTAARELSLGAAPAAKAFIGLDGFVDSIIHVVDKRRDFNSYTRVETISELARRIAGAAGLSANIELVVTQTKLGGNGPIFANALCELGVSLDYVGSVGEKGGEPHPVFKALSEKARVIPICPPGQTDALEFTDGKIMLGKHSALGGVTYDALLSGVGGEGALEAAIGGAGLFGMENWTMLPHMSEILEKITEKILPRLKEKTPAPIAFFDLADPEKRPKADVLRALGLIGRFGEKFRVVLGLNEKEAREIAGFFGAAGEELPLRGLTELIYEKTGVHCAVVHPTKGAGAQTPEGFFYMPGPYCENPVLTTGAGDNFNAGFCFALTAGLSVLQALAAGVYTSGYYVRNAKSPTARELSEFMAQRAGASAEAD